MTREEFFSKLDAGAKWDVGVSIARTNPLPLDANEVFRSVVEMETYIKENALAYPGQIVVVLGETETAAYLVSVVGGEGKGYAKLAATTGSGDVGEELTALAARVAANEAAIKELQSSVKAAQGTIGEHTTTLGSYGTRISAVEAKALANESSISGVSDRVTANEGAISTANSNISANTSAIAEINTALADVYTKSQTDTKIAEEIGKQAHFSAKVVTSTDEMTDPTTLYLVKDESTAGEDKYKEYMVIGGTPTIIGDTSTNLSDYATTESVNASIAAVNQTITDKDAAMGTRVDGVAEDLATDKADLAAFKTTVSTTYQTKADATTDKSALEEAIGSKAAQSDLQALQTTVGNQDTAIKALQTADTGFENRIKALEDVGAQKNVINSVETTEFEVDTTGKLSIKSIAQDKITGLAGALSAIDTKFDTKVDKVEGSRLITTAEGQKLEKLVLNEDGSVEVSGEVAAGNVKGLGEWITTHRADTAGLLSAAQEAKLNGIASGAQVNVLEGIQVANNDLSVVDKKVNIPIAADQLGVVLSSTGEDKIKVEADGSMSVNSVNITKLTQSADTILVLDGGNA